jgi:hypothetical protein
MERTLAEPLAARRRATLARLRVEQTLSFDARMAALESIYEDLAARATPFAQAVV